MLGTLSLSRPLLAGGYPWDRNCYFDLFYHFDILISSTIFHNNYILYNKIILDSTTYHVYSILIPQTDHVALQCIDALRAHCTEHNDGYIILGGDLNCTLNPSLDRFHTSFERRIKVSRGLKNLMSESGTSGADKIPPSVNTPGLEIQRRPHVKGKTRQHFYI